MSEKKSLDYLLESIACSRLGGPDPAAVRIGSVVSDSREVGPDSLFVALPGVKSDGHIYVSEVAARGCAAIIVERGKLHEDDYRHFGGCIVAVDDSREIYAEIVARFYDHPEKGLKLIGITGTNGKTTISYLLEKVLEDQGLRVGVIGTVNYRFTNKNHEKKQFPAPFTTPDPLILQRQLRMMADEGVDVVLMEVSSHALVQKRLGNLQFDVAAFTNLSHDHLDYHRTMGEYFRAKTLLFSEHLRASGQAVVTFKDSGDAVDNKWASALAILLQEQKIPFCSCGRQKGAAIQPVEVEVEIHGTKMVFLTTSGTFHLVSPLVGRFNVDNIMTTLGIVTAMGLEVGRAVKSLETAMGAPGRLERVELRKGELQKAIVFVDYAHTPDALLNVLQTLKALPHARLLCVFGCGGDRDKTKRQEMGSIAASYADIAVVTDDNPRSESPQAILQQVTEGVRATGKKEMSPQWRLSGETGYVVVPDRQEAIFSAVNYAMADDIVLIAGKGHEKYQITAKGKRFFDDCLEAREALFSWDSTALNEALGVEPVNSMTAAGLTDVCTDSRKVGPGQIFVALHGENFDGHDYLQAAISAGAACVIVSDTEAVAKVRQRQVYRVDDTLRALGELARYRRSKIAALSAPVVVGITGSCGKTTVKEMLAAIFGKRWPDGPGAPLNRVLRTMGNFNNLIGLPLSLLPIRLKHTAVILEMGMNQPGEIARLAEIAEPDISCIVNVHGAHLQGLGTIEGVAGAKEELFAGTSPHGLLVVNLDDPYVAASATKYPQRKICFSMGEQGAIAPDLWAADISCGQGGKISFALHIGTDSRRVNLGVPGRHNVANSLAAAAIAHGAGTDIQVIAEGLEAFEAVDKRLQIVRSAAGYTIINDTYNANPASMAAALATLASMIGRKKIAILGDMLELGQAAEEAHRLLGGIAATSGLFALAVCGSFAACTVEGALAAGMEPTSVRTFADKDAMCRWIESLEDTGELREDSWMLVKASRGMRFETVVEKLVDTHTGNG